MGPWAGMYPLFFIEKHRIELFQACSVSFCVDYVMRVPCEFSFFVDLLMSNHLLEPIFSQFFLQHTTSFLFYRLLELKNEMVNLEFSEYHFFDDVLSDMKLTPADIEIPVPRYFTQVIIYAPLAFF